MLKNIQKHGELYCRWSLNFALLLCSAAGKTQATERRWLEDTCGTNSYIKTSKKPLYKISGVLGLMLFLCLKVITSSGKRNFELWLAIFLYSHQDSAHLSENITDMKVCVLQTKPADGMGDYAGDTGGRQWLFQAAIKRFFFIFRLEIHW